MGYDDVELESDMLKLLHDLFRSIPTLSRDAILRAIETTLPESTLSGDDQEILRAWINDVRERRV